MVIKFIGKPKVSSGRETGPRRVGRGAARGDPCDSLLKNLVSPGQTKEGKPLIHENKDNTEKELNQSIYKSCIYIYILPSIRRCKCKGTKHDPCSFIYSTHYTTVVLHYFMDCTTLPILKPAFNTKSWILEAGADHFWGTFHFTVILKQLQLTAGSWSTLCCIHHHVLLLQFPAT